MNIEFFGKILRNFEVFKQAQKIGFEYLLNPSTGELHRVHSDFIGSHNLHIADLSNFIGLTNIGLMGVHVLTNGTSIPIYDLDSGALLGTYTLNKCEHCM